jgi:hypothetical protein
MLLSLPSALYHASESGSGVTSARFAQCLVPPMACDRPEPSFLRVHVSQQRRQHRAGEVDDVLAQLPTEVRELLQHA